MTKFLALLLVTACSSTSNYKPKMPPCVVQGERGVWLSADGGQSYRCISQTDMQRIRGRLGL